jgi:hypothetical protein
VLNTKPPSFEKVSHILSTSSRTCAGVPNGKVFCVSTPPPQKTMSLPNSLFSLAGPYP